MATILLAGGLGFGSYQLGILDQPHAMALAGGCLAGLLLTPDLDVDTGSNSDDWARSFGRLPGLLWFLVWRPYAALVPHRSPLSHFPILGTVLRLGYLSAVIVLLSWCLHFVIPMRIPAILSMPWWFPLYFVGLALADLGHWVLDNTIRMPRPTYAKRL
jgi:uncharacterized metal-binding protein